MRVTVRVSSGADKRSRRVDEIITASSDKRYEI